MNTFRRLFIKTAHEILVNALGHKRYHWGGRLTNRDKRSVKRHISVYLILLHALGPETVAAASDIPVTHIINEILQRFGRLRYTVILQMVVYHLYRRIEAGKQPFIHNTQLIICQRMFCRIKLVNFRIENIKCIRVPECAHKLPLPLGHGLTVKTVWQPRRTVNIEIPADCIRPIFGKRLKRVNGISFALAHLLPVLVLYETENDNIFIWRLVEQESRLCHQGVEPPARLVNSFRNELCRKLRLKKFFILKRIMILRKRHGSGIKPAVDYFRHTLHKLAAVRTGKCHFVNIRAVKFYLRHFRPSATLCQLGPTADTFLMSAALAFPYIQRRSPIAVSGNRPVLYIFQPVSKPALANRFRNPIDRIIIRYQFVFYRCLTNVPRFARIVYKWLVATPAMRIFMFKFWRVKKLPSGVKILDYFPVGVFDKQSGKRRLFGHFTLTVDKLHKWQIVIASHFGIVFTKRRRNMYDTCTVRHRYIGIARHKETFFILIIRTHFCAFEQRLILFVLKRSTLETLQNFVCFYALVLFGKFSKYSIKKLFRHIVSITVCGFYFTISIFRVDAERHVTRQCPRCCRPCKKIGVFVCYLKADYRRAFFHRLVPLRYFLRRQRRSTARTVRNNLKSFVQKLFVPYFF